MSLDERKAKGSGSRSEIPISKGWVQGVALVLILGFFVMGILAYRTYTDSMPLPQQVVSTEDEVVFTEEQVTEGQQIFLRRGLQQYGSIVGHGAYLGPDYTAEYLRLSSEHIRESLASQGVQDPQAAKIGRASCRERVETPGGDGSVEKRRASRGERGSRDRKSG